MEYEEYMCIQYEILRMFIVVLKDNIINLNTI